MNRHTILLAACLAALPPMVIAQATVADQDSSGPVRQSVVINVHRTDDDSVVRGARRLATREPIYYLQSSGGSAMLALLIGPLGAVANRSNIDAITKGEAQVIERALAISPSITFAASLASFSWSTDRAASKITSVSPFVLVYRNKDDRLFVRCGIDAYAEKWIGRYTSHLSFAKTFTEISGGVSADDLRSLTSEMERAFDQALHLLDDDVNGRLPSPKDVLVRSPQVTLNPVLTKMRLLSADDDALLIWGSGGGESRVFPYSGYHGLSRTAITELTPR